jgi:(2R)-sulfolactate sulfo-lyase subunit alpha
LHDAKDTVAVVVVEGVKAGMELAGWIMDEDRMTNVSPGRHPHRPQGGAEGHGRRRHRVKYGIDMGKVVAPIKAGEHAHVQNIKTKRW